MHLKLFMQPITGQAYADNHLVFKVKFVGGVNRPKLVECLDSQGQTHRQLVKSGHDDLRQDAVMQQFFHLLNSFLQSRPSSRRRCLRIATYKAGLDPAHAILVGMSDTMLVHMCI